MSDSQKQQRYGATPIKNPLLSASVTGLTFDDCPNKPLLLPAAPAIVHPPVPSPVVTACGLIPREPKSLVTVGSSSLDTEHLDEINLNSSNEDNQTSEVSDPNANSLLEQINQAPTSDSILSQAASSFSALPSVASNVFSTFSKRITSISNSRETTPVYDPYQQDLNSNTSGTQLDIQPAFIQQSQGDLPQAPSQFYVPPLGGNTSSCTFAASSEADIQKNLAVAEPPKFYTPTYVPPVPSISAAPPTNLGGQNNFRFSSKKKLYAPIPGLSDESQKPTTTLDVSAVNSPTSYSANNYHSQSQSQYPIAEGQKEEPRKLGIDLFSKVVNLAPTGILQNITGRVQLATASIPQTNKPDSYQEAPLPVFVAPPPPTNYFIPTNTESSLTIAGQSNDQNTQPLAVFSAQKSETSNLFTPQLINPGGISESIYQPQQSQTQIPLFNSSDLPTQINPNASFQSTPQPSHVNTPPFFNVDQSNRTETSLNTAPQVSFYDSTKYLPPSSLTSAQTGRPYLTSHALPPTIKQSIPPPVPQGSAHTSYRLQKGTKLYKSPLTPQETAPIQVTPTEIQSVNTYPSQETFTKPQSVSLFAPPPVGEQNFLQSVPFIEPPSTFVAESVRSQTPHSVSLFVPPTPVVRSSLPLQGVPEVKELKSNETSQSVSLFAASNKPIQNYPLLAPQVQVLKTEDEKSVSFAPPPIKKLKSEEAIQPEPSGFVETKKTLESLENKFLTEVSTQDSNPNINDITEIQPIFEPIEPVIDEDITEIKKETDQDPIEETLQKLSLAESYTEAKTVKLPPIGESFNLKNPYRKGSATETAKPAPILPTLANFFTPTPSKALGDLNFFTALPSTQSSGNAKNLFPETVQGKEINKENLEPVDTLQAEIGNFFTTPSHIPELTPLEPYTSVHPPISAFFPTRTGSVPAILEDKDAILKHLNLFESENVPPPTEFENFIHSEATIASVKSDIPPVHENNTTVQQETRSQTKQPEIVNRFSNYFNQGNHQPEIAKDPLTFFDSFPGQKLKQPQQQQQQQQQLQQPHLEVTAPSSVVTNEEQRIQYFFNNPPPKDASHVGDLNYDLVHSGLSIKNLQQRSLTPISNLVEPPSSACSEFSEISNTTAGQKSIAANLSFNESSDILIEREETNRSLIEEQDSEILNSSIKHCQELPEEILKELRMAKLLAADKTATSPVASVSYKPAVKHWFFKRTINDKQIWVPFSHYDSALLETSLLMEDDEKTNIVAVEGGRYDVNISERKKTSVYWDSDPIEVRRCSWFYKAIDSRYVPYEEQTAELLESEYKQAAESSVWHKTIVLGMGEQVVFHGPTVIVHFQQQQNCDAWGGTTQTATRPRVVKRDLDDFSIEQGESQKVDHLLFMVHGIGSACDLKLRSVEEVVEDFRTIAGQLVQSHYKNSTDLGLVGRVEVLPISWHSHLHSVEMGIDEKLRMITLESIPKLRNFTNDTLLDILFYTSPTFCQKIMNTIVASMNTLYLKYRERHPEFNGGVSLAGHSLGSLILFDLLCHQNPIKESEEKNHEDPNQFSAQMDSNQLEDKQMSYTMGPAGTGQPFINYGQLIFQPKKFFALGSPIGMFVTIRGIDKLGLDFRLPTCPGFYNIFHPYDPVAYRIEALVNADLSVIRPVLIPHHKGRKRMHLELKETMTRVSMDLKNRFLDKFKTTLDSVNIFGSAFKSTKEAEELMEKEVDKVIQMQMQLEQQNHSKNSSDTLPTGSNSQTEISATPRQRTDSVSTAMSDDVVEIDFPLGKLNDSKRIDYVLQEAPLEFINEYIFALSSHVCYWDSEDTILFVMKEIYSGLGISPDSQVPQQTMTIERPSSCNSLLSSS